MENNKIFLVILVILIGLYILYRIARKSGSRFLFWSFERTKQTWAYSKLKSKYEKLVEENQRYRQAIDGANAVHWEWNGEQQPKINPVKGNMSSKVHRDDIKQLRNHLERCMLGNSSQFECEHRVKDSNGRCRWVITRGQVVVGRDATVEKIVGMSFDITVKHTEEIKLIEMASKDSLTGLLNRSSFADKVHEFLDSTKNAHKKAVLLYLDIDDFKSVNDNWGHDVGDAYLIETALRLKSSIRDKDSIARLGGDEFAILIDDIENPDEIKTILVRIQKAFEKPFEISDHEYAMAVSIGAAVLPDDGRTVESLMKCADMEMYRSKRFRKNNFNYYYEQLNSKQLSDKSKVE